MSPLTLGDRQNGSGVVGQPSLLDLPALYGDTHAVFDPAALAFQRVDLSGGAWVDLAEGAVRGAGVLFDALLNGLAWAQHERPMFERLVIEPRLSCWQLPDPPPVLSAVAQALSARYGLDLGALSANLYRDGNDSVAWHGDRIRHRRGETVVAVLSLGARRRFLLRPTGGGPGRRFAPGSGDLLVMGGTCQRTWQHHVPKCASSGPRISVMFREALDAPPVTPRSRPGVSDV